MRARALDAAGWASGAAALAIALGGGASRPEGWLLGLPSLTAAFAGMAVLIALAAVTGSAAPRLLLGLAPVTLLVSMGVPLPGVATLAGPPLAVLVLAAMAAALAAASPPWAKAALLPVIAAVYGLAAARGQAQVGPEGDEPHYLMVADSLLRDGDLGLERDYAEARYVDFHPRPLAPHYRVRGRGGEIYSLHAVGLSLLVLPAYALGGYAAASFFMALLAVWLARELRELLRASIGAGADGVAWLMALSPPLVHYAGLVFTEIPAALIVALALRHGRGATSRVALATGAAVAFLPWLNVRYAVVAAALLVHALSRVRRIGLALSWVVPSALSAAALCLYHFRLYGFFDPRRVYGRRPELSLSGLPTGLPGLLLDQEFGLLVYAPVFVLAVPGAVALWRRSRGLALVSAALVGSAFMVAGSWPMWRGGFNPPARFLVPVVPALALAVAARLGGGLAAPAAILAGWSLWTGAIGTWDRSLVHRDRDQTAPLLRAASGAEEWTRLLPGYVLEESERDRAALAATWSVALLVAAACAKGAAARARPGGLAAASLALVAAAGVASRLSSARTQGRDAVRLVGRPALAVPGWRPLPRADGVWTADVLDWGPLYEPHRAPAGAVLGARLPLGPGRYTITIEGEGVPSGLPPPILESGPEGTRDGDRLVPTPGGLAGWFTVPPGRPETTLRLRSGGPFIVSRMRLEAPQPFPPPPGQNN
ncbi:MAG TPA: hypothetical protein VMR21_05955 [Vicinamibacteria bacterium]|nr:hypothetical protein [Vicinamibacteria bacterium]